MLHHSLPSGQTVRQSLPPEIRKESEDALDIAFKYQKDDNDLRLEQLRKEDALADIDYSGPIKISDIFPDSK